MHSVCKIRFWTRSLSEGSLVIDIDHDSRGAVSLTGNKEDEVAYMQVNGMLSSLYENLIWEEMTGAKSVSTMAVLEKATEQEIKLLVINSENYEEMIGKLEASDAVIQDIKTAVGNGKEVTVPAEEVSIDGWTGSGYIIMDPDTGAGAYRISGGLNGGSTSGRVTMYAVLGLVLAVVDIVECVIGILSICFTAVIPAGLTVLLVLDMLMLCAAAVELINLFTAYWAYAGGDEEAGEQIVISAKIELTIGLFIEIGGRVLSLLKAAGSDKWLDSRIFKKIKDMFGDSADDVPSGKGDGDGTGTGNVDGDGTGGNTDGDGTGNTDGDNGGNTDGDGPGNTDGDNGGNTDGDDPGNTDGDNTSGDGDVNGTPGGTGDTGGTGGTGDGNLAGSGGGGSSDNTGNGTGTATGILTYEEAEELAFNAIKGKKNAEYVVLGKYDNGGPTSYVEVAKDMDAQYFQLDNWNELAEKYSDDEIWKINEKFLDIQMSSGREIYLSHDPKKSLGDGTFYAKELQYLKENGYRIVDEGGIWHAIR